MLLTKEIEMKPEQEIKSPTGEFCRQTGLIVGLNIGRQNLKELLADPLK
jgi:hypothetical protein